MGASYELFAGFVAFYGRLHTTAVAVALSSLCSSLLGQNGKT